MCVFSLPALIPLPAESRRPALAGPLKPGLNATLDKFYQSLTKRIGTWLCCSTTERVRLNTRLAESLAVTYAEA
jgi:hypothetical protein